MEPRRADPRRRPTRPAIQPPAFSSLTIQARMVCMISGGCPAAKSRPCPNRREMAAPSAGRPSVRRIESPTCVGIRALRLRCVRGDALLRQGGPADTVIRGSVPDSYRCSPSRDSAHAPARCRPALILTGGRRVPYACLPAAATPPSAAGNRHPRGSKWRLIQRSLYWRAAQRAG